MNAEKAYHILNDLYNISSSNDGQIKEMAVDIYYMSSLMTKLEAKKFKEIISKGLPNDVGFDVGYCVSRLERLTINTINDGIILN